MRRTKPNLTIFLLIVFVTGLFVCDGFTAYFKIPFPLTLLVYLLWGIPLGMLSRWMKRKLNKRNAENE